MAGKLTIIRKYLQYLLNASNSKGHGMHSPFVFDFITRVMSDTKPYSAYKVVHDLRKKLLRDQTVLTVEDLGAGSMAANSRQRSIASIAATAAKPAKYGQLLYRIANYYKPRTIIELGTSLGITTSYLALADHRPQVITLEGAKAVSSVAATNFDELKLSNIRLVEGNFDDTLPLLLNELKSFDLVFVDGNHRREPTLRYFEELLKRATNESVIIFDDIHWSEEMESAWETIKAHPATRCTADLFFIGIVWLRQEFREKQHFIIRF